jgi:hypothetical protein
MVMATPGRKKLDNDFIDKIIMEHMRLNKRALQRQIYMEVEGKNRDIRREAIGRRINTLLREDKIFIIRQIGGEPFYGYAAND